MTSDQINDKILEEEKQNKSTQHIGHIQHKKLGMNKIRKITRKLQKPVKRWSKIKGKRKKNFFLNCISNNSQFTISQCFSPLGHS